MTPADDYVNRVLDHLPSDTPMRAQIAMELRGNIAERLESGQPGQTCCGNSAIRQPSPSCT